MRHLEFERALVLGAHTDDEFGCAGTIQRLVDAGAEVHYAVFSTCEESIPEGFPRDALAHEVVAATGRLGIPRENLEISDFRVRHFPAARQDILEKMVSLRERLAPDLVLLPALSDIHQDHHVIATEGLRAFKFASILGYELPMNTITFQHAGFFEMTEAQLETKIEALSCYASQQSRSYMNPEFIASLARVRGLQAGATFAEAFEVLRLRY